MHSRVFQLIPVTKVYDEENLLGADWLEDRDLPHADYYTDVHPDELVQEYEWMKNVYEKFPRIQFSVDEEGRHLVTFKKGCQEDYFRDRLYMLKDKVESLSLDDFSKDFDDEDGSFSLKIFEITNLIDDRFGFYFYEDYALSADDFIRALTFTDTKERTYYLGGVVDYHY